MNTLLKKTGVSKVWAAMKKWFDDFAEFLAKKLGKSADEIVEGVNKTHLDDTNKTHADDVNYQKNEKAIETFISGNGNSSLSHIIITI